MVTLPNLLVVVGFGRELGHLEEVLIIFFLAMHCEEEGSWWLEVMGDGHVIPQVPVAERRDLKPLAVCRNVFTTLPSAPLLE
jgi:hypothetical protein